MHKSKILVLSALGALAVAFFILDGHRYFTFENLKAQVAAAQTYYQSNRAEAVAGYLLLYVLIAGLSLPGRRNAEPATLGMP